MEKFKRERGGLGKEKESAKAGPLGARRRNKEKEMSGPVEQTLLKVHRKLTKGKEKSAKRERADKKQSFYDE